MTKKIMLGSAIGFIALLCLYNYAHMQPAKEDIIRRIIEYPIDTHIIARCQKDFGYSDQDMVILERELKRYFALGRAEKSPFGMFSKDVDNLWHTFILFTKQYTEFGKKCANRYIHHVPNIDKGKTPEKRAQAAEDFITFVEAYERTFGEPVHDIWLLDMCEHQPHTVDEL